MSKTKFGTFDELMAQAANPTHEAIARRLRKIVVEIDPDYVEVVRLGDRAATYGIGPKKMSEGYVYIMPQKKWVNLGFFRGALLDDPENLMEGTGAKMRHVKVRSAESVENPALHTLIKAALAERTNALGR